MSKRKTQRHRGKMLTTVQIDTKQASKMDGVADKMGVSRAQAVRWAIEYFDLELFLSSSFSKETITPKKQAQPA